MTADYDELFGPDEEPAPQRADRIRADHIRAPTPPPTPPLEPARPAARHARPNDRPQSGPPRRTHRRPAERNGPVEPVELETETARKPAKRPVSQHGWRRTLHAATRINVGLSPGERRAAELRASIRRDVRGSHQITVLGLKGGVGRTAVTVALGSVLADLRGDRILAFDADPVSGNLAERAGQQPRVTIADLVACRSLRTFNDIRAYTVRNAADLEVLAAQHYGAAPRALRDDEWDRAINGVVRFYNVVLADCGTDLFDPAAAAALSATSGIVIVTSAAVDGVRQAAITMNWLNANGYQSLVARACVVVNHLIPGKPSMAVQEIVRRLESHVAPGRLIVLPWDDHVAAGTGIKLGSLGASYRAKITELAAALSDDFGGGQRPPAATAPHDDGTVMAPRRGVGSR